MSMTTNDTVLVIPDVHQKTEQVEQLLGQAPPHSHVVWLGDWFDDFHDTPSHAQRMALWLTARMESHPQDVFLWGNHDLPYAYPIRELLCSGWSPGKARIIKAVLRPEHWKRFRFHAWVGERLLTHAGLHPKLLGVGGVLTPDWLDDRTKAASRCLETGQTDPLYAAGRSRGGRELVGGVTWLDWGEFTPIPGVSQIVGHTPASEVRVLGSRKAANYCLDTHLRHYAVIHDGEIEVRPNR